MLPIPPRQLALYALAALLILGVGWRYAAPRTSAGAGSYADAAPSPPSADAGAGSAPAGPSVVVVDVTGAVRRPGVYRLSGGARVLDAVDRARPRASADLGAINLAARLADGEQVAVPRRGASAAATAPTAAGAPGAPAAIVHLNSATLEQLEALDGIGPALAGRIIAYRTEHGGFGSVAELDAVSGIGPARLAALRDQVAP